MHTTAPIHVTQSAARTIFSLMVQERNKQLKLRISVKGGGCSGFKYQFAFSEQTKAGDHRLLVPVLLPALLLSDDISSCLFNCYLLLHPETTPDAEEHTLTQADASTQSVYLLHPHDERKHDSEPNTWDDAALDNLMVRDDYIQVLVDKFSIHYLKGAVIRYVQNEHGKQFIIHNPKATTTCSCGSSFNVD